MSNSVIVPLGCVCGTTAQASVDLPETIHVACPACGFEWEISRRRTENGAVLRIRPLCTGRSPITFRDSDGGSLTLEPHTPFPRPE